MARNGIKECVVDTNVLVYDTIEDSEYHETASAIIDNLDTVSYTHLTLPTKRIV